MSRPRAAPNWRRLAPVTSGDEGRKLTASKNRNPGDGCKIVEYIDHEDLEVHRPVADAGTQVEAAVEPTGGVLRIAAMAVNIVVGRVADDDAGGQKPTPAFRPKTAVEPTVPAELTGVKAPAGGTKIATARYAVLVSKGNPSPMRSFFQLMSSSILVIGLAGCGNNDKPADANGTTTATATTTTTEAAPAAAPVDAAPMATTAAVGAASVAAPAGGAAVTYASMTGDVAHGEKVFTQCKTCHVAEQGVNRIGPSLWGVVGRKSGSIPNYQYSAANKNSGLTWTEDQLFSYLAAPQKVVPGTKMAFAGLKKPQDRADVIAYLKTRA